MIAKLEMGLVSDNPRIFSYHNSSLTQGILMEKISREYGKVLHQSQLQPYSQNFIREGEKLYWTVNTLNIESTKQILDILEKDEFKQIYMRDKDCSLKIVRKKREQISYDKLLQDYYFEDRNRFLKIKFKTPTAFKQNKNYCIFPTPRLIFQSLMLRYDSYAKENRCFDEEILEQYEKYSSIVQYKLQSTKFSMEGIKIPSFVGEVTIKISGPQQMVNLAWMLIKFGTYCGVGIKTAMGMGAIEIEEKEG